MIIDSAAFTPVSAALGGLMIGIAVAVLLLFNGRIAGSAGSSPICSQSRAAGG